MTVPQHFRVLAERTGTTLESKDHYLYGVTYPYPEHGNNAKLLFYRVGMHNWWVVSTDRTPDELPVIEASILDWKARLLGKP